MRLIIKGAERAHDCFLAYEFVEHWAMQHDPATGNYAVYIQDGVRGDLTKTKTGYSVLLSRQTERDQSQ